VTTHQRERPVAEVRHDHVDSHLPVPVHQGQEVVDLLANHDERAPVVRVETDRPGEERDAGLLRVLHVPHVVHVVQRVHVAPPGLQEEPEGADHRISRG
jgi:hypothetical protein